MKKLRIHRGAPRLRGTLAMLVHAGGNVKGEGPVPVPSSGSLNSLRAPREAADLPMAYGRWRMV